MDDMRTPSLTDMLAGQDWVEVSRGIGFREGRARTLFNNAALYVLQSALAALAAQGKELLLTELAEEAARIIMLDPSCSDLDRRHAALKFMKLFRSLPRPSDTAPPLPSPSSSS